MRNDALITLYSRHAAPDRIDSLPYSAGAVFSSRNDFVASDGGFRSQDPGTNLQATMRSDGDVATGEIHQMSVGDVLDARIAQRRETLIHKGQAEFQVGNYQRAFGQFVLASSIADGAAKDPRRLVLLSSIATGNYARGAKAFAALLEEDPELFVDDYYGIEWLYPESIEIGEHTMTGEQLFERHVYQLRAFRSRAYGDASPVVIYPYVLWVKGKHLEAKLAAQDIVDKAAHSVVADVARRILARMNQQEAEPDSNSSSVWTELLR